jgi:hypothetical protein
MLYSDIRRKFVELSGRYDLVDSIWNDAGADFFLNAGQMLLDDMITLPKSQGRYLEKVIAGTAIVKVLKSKSIEEVWVTKADKSRIQLVKATLLELRTEYGEELSIIDRGDPIYYAPVALRPIPDVVTSTTLLNVLDKDDLVLNDTHYPYNGVLMMPPTLEAVTVAVVGTFYSPDLSAVLVGSTWTQTQSFWTNVHPLALLYAGLYVLETFYRNTEGAKDWMGALQIRLQGIDYNTAEQDSAGVNQMEG